jgi:hypothetical protein
MNSMKSKLASLAAVALLAAAGSSQAALVISSPVIAADTATNLDISWSWHLDTSFPGAYTSSPALNYWSAYVTAQKVGTVGTKYYLDVGADYSPSSSSFEFEAGIWQKGFGQMAYSSTDVISGRTYAVEIATDPSNSHKWDVHLTGVAPVPEPGEWALMLSGFGLIALMVRRRTANAS